MPSWTLALSSSAEPTAPSALPVRPNTASSFCAMASKLFVNSLRRAAAASCSMVRWRFTYHIPNSASSCLRRDEPSCAIWIRSRYTAASSSSLARASSPGSSMRPSRVALFAAASWSAASRAFRSRISSCSARVCAAAWACIRATMSSVTGLPAPRIVSTASCTERRFLNSTSAMSCASLLLPCMAFSNSRTAMASWRALVERLIHSATSFSDSFRRKAFSATSCPFSATSMRCCSAAVRLSVPAFSSAFRRIRCFSVSSMPAVNCASTS